MKKIVLIVLLIIVLAILAFAIYMGAFSSVVIEEREEGPFTFVYREMNGNDMKQVAEITVALNTLLGERGIARRKPLDIFFPDGRAEIGFAIEGALPGQITGLSDQAKVREIPAQRCMVARFPWRNTLSFIVGYLKVDPALTNYRTEHGYSRVEAYSLDDGDTIVYMQPVSRHK